MGLFLTLAFLFFIGSVFGWVLELFFRRFISAANPERKWINPGFCTGPYLPLYGSGLCILFLIASLENKTLVADPIGEKVLLFVWMAVCMTAIEYVAGLLMIQVAHVRLWDYSNEWGNIQGIICPKFSFFWAVLGAAYYFLIHPTSWAPCAGWPRTWPSPSSSGCFTGCSSSTWPTPWGWSPG